MEPDAKLTIVKIDHQNRLGNIIHVYVDGVKVKTSANPEQYSEVVSHMPFSEAAVDSSVTRQVGTVTTLPDFQEGYSEWRTSFETGDAGIFTISVGKAVEYTEQTSLQGQEVKE